MTSPIRVESRRFGRIEVPAADLIRIDGLPGFPDARRFLLLHHDRDSLFAWLVCADDPDLAFVVTDPWLFFPDYAPALEPAHLSRLRAEPGSETQLLVIADVRGGEIHLNLAAPLLLNAGSRRAVQVILESGDLSPRAGVPQQAPPRPTE